MIVSSSTKVSTARSIGIGHPQVDRHFLSIHSSHPPTPCPRSVVSQLFRDSLHARHIAERILHSPCERPDASVSRFAAHLEDSFRLCWTTFWIRSALAKSKPRNFRSKIASAPRAPHIRRASYGSIWDRVSACF